MIRRDGEVGGWRDVKHLRQRVFRPVQFAVADVAARDVHNRRLFREKRFRRKRIDPFARREKINDQDGGKRPNLPCSRLNHPRMIEQGADEPDSGRVGQRARDARVNDVARMSEKKLLNGNSEWRNAPE